MTIFDFACAHPLVSVALGIGALAASPVIGSVVSEVQDLLRKLFQFIGNFFFVTMRMEDEAACNVVLFYLRENYQTFSMGEDHFNNEMDKILGKGLRTVFFRFPVKSLLLFIYNGAPIICTPSKGEGYGEGDKKQRATFRFLRGTLDFNRLLSEAAERYDEYIEAIKGKNRAFRIHKIAGGHKDKDDIKTTMGGGGGICHGIYNRVPVNFSVEELEPEPVNSELALLSSTPAHEKIIRDVTFWKNNRKWYDDGGLTWKRGYLIYGEPGTGKTSLIRAILQDLDIPICIFNMGSMQESQFPGAWEYALSCGYPRAIVLEDFDTVFNGRVNQNHWSSLTFSTVLNHIDGIEQNSGTLIFITTNRPDHIDEALGRPNEKEESTRPGRVDVVLKIPNLDYEGRYKIAMRVIRNEEEARKVAVKYENETPAAFTEHCKARALELLWGKKEEVPADIKFVPVDPNWKPSPPPASSGSDPKTKPATIDAPKLYETKLSDSTSVFHRTPSPPEGDE